MPTDDPNAHAASIEVPVDAGRALAFLADGMAQTHWALGSWDRRDLGGGLFVGTSLFDGTELYVRLEAHHELLLVDYSIGPDPADLRRLVEARVVPGDVLGRDPGVCVITLTVWRSTAFTPEAWARTYHAFKTEVHLIRGRLAGGRGHPGR